MQSRIFSANKPAQDVQPRVNGRKTKIACKLDTFLRLMRLLCSDLALHLLLQQQEVQFRSPSQSKGRLLFNMTCPLQSGGLFIAWQMKNCTGSRGWNLISHKSL